MLNFFRGCWIFLSICLIASIGLFPFLGKFLAAPAQYPEKADLITALGGGDPKARVSEALRLYREGYAKHILITGVEQEAQGAQAYFINWRVAYLIDHGVPHEVIFLDRRSINSWTEAVNTLDFLKKHGWRRVLVVSDPPHMRRLEWTWHKVFRGSGREFRLVASRPSWWNARMWWRNKDAAVFSLKEVAKNVYYRLNH